MTSTSGLSIKLCESPEELALCHAIRKEVFVDEQGFSLADEFDEKEDGSDHILLTQHGEPIGTIRWYPPMGKLGRLAVKKTGRGLGAGRILVRALEEHVAAGKAKAGVAQRASGVKEVLVVANSQAHAQGFYAKLGYEAEGEHFLEDGEPHVRMVKTIILL